MDFMMAILKLQGLDLNGINEGIHSINLGFGQGIGNVFDKKMKFWNGCSSLIKVKNFTRKNACIEALNPERFF